MDLFISCCLSIYLLLDIATRYSELISKPNYEQKTYRDGRSINWLFFPLVGIFDFWDCFSHHHFINCKKGNNLQTSQKVDLIWLWNIFIVSTVLILKTLPSCSFHTFNNVSSRSLLSASVIIISSWLRFLLRFGKNRRLWVSERALFRTHNSHN